jgi:hypothetical protein
LITIARNAAQSNKKLLKPEIPGIFGRTGAHCFMDSTTTLNYAIAFVVLAGALAIGLAILVW